MDVKMNSELINETVDDVVSTVNFLCKNDLSYLELTTKLDVLNEKMDTLQTLVVYSNDDKFTKTICAMQLITDNFNDEISKDFGVTFSNDFKERQLNFLRNISSSFDVNIIEVDNIDSLSNTKENIHKQYTKKVDKTKKEYQKENTKQTVDYISKATNDKLNSYFESKEDIKEYLKYMSKFHNYSIGNCAKIEEQFSGARAVGSFKFWKDNGFTVNKGEKGIQILIPTPIKNFYDEEGNIKRVYFATKEQKEKLKKGILKDAPPTMSYKKGYVFDVSQTNATAEDLPKLFPNKWLDGEIENYDKMYKAMESVANDIGVNIIAPKSELGVAKGVSYTMTKEVALNPRNSQLQNVKTLLHELAHAKLHTANTRHKYSKAEKEFQAEMVAYSVCSYFNIDTSEYSLSYLNHYSKNTDIKEKKKLLNEIKDTSSEFITIIENSLFNDRDIEKTIESKNTNEQNIETVADVVESKEKIYTKFLFSEEHHIEENSIYEFEDANELIRILTQRHFSRKESDPNYEVAYFKTSFELHFNKDCTDKFYSGRVDIGDGFARDLKEHIYKVVEGGNFNMSENIKKYLFDILKINTNKEIAKDKDLSL